MMLGMHAYSMTHPLTLVIAIVLYYSSAVVTNIYCILDNVF